MDPGRALPSQPFMRGHFQFCSKYTILYISPVAAWKLIPAWNPEPYLQPGRRPGFVWETLDGLEFTFGPFNFQQARLSKFGAGDMGFTPEE